MPTFPFDPRGYRYRGLRLREPWLRGWDVVALQSGLGITADGAFGPATRAAVVGFQSKHRLEDDGIAGVLTQREIALSHLWPNQKSYGTPPGLARGQIEAESSFWLGNQSLPYEHDDGSTSYDLGVVQRNTRYATPEQAFDVPLAIETLVARLAAKHKEYADLGKVTDERRLWELASGSWNAPAWCDRLASGKALTPSQSDHIESYISRSTVYMVLA